MKLKGAFLAACCVFAASVSAQTVTFDNGWEDWSGPAGVGGTTGIEADGGNPGANAHTVFEDFGITYRTTSNAAFLGDLTSSDTITVSIDVKVDSITYEGIEVPRKLLVDFRSQALAENGYPYTSVWHVLTPIQAGMDWATYSVTFAPGDLTLPSGWGGYGAENPDTAEPQLPADVSFADVMANVDELAFTTLEPGYVYGFTLYDMCIDNIRIDRGGSDVIFTDGFDIVP